MSLRSTFIALAFIVAFCGAGLYLLNSALSREAQIRDAELGFAEAHRDEIAAANTRLNAEELTTTSASVDEPLEATPDASEEPLSLDAWYASAGTSEGPADTTPEDKSYLINDTEPYSDGEPITDF